MADVHTPQVRSFNMSRIKGKNTKPEIVVRKYLHSLGVRFRLHSAKLPGKPDIVLKKLDTIIFIHGCFWHGHSDCKYFVVPKTKTQWWLEKIGKNKSSDKKHVHELRKAGWRVITIWECQLKPTKKEKTLSKLKSRLRGNVI